MSQHRFGVVNAILRGAFVIAVFWTTAFILVQFSERTGAGWAASETGEVLACALGVFLALRFNVKPVAYLLAGQLAFTVSELALHLIYGNRSVQGGPTHVAVMLAGTLGVALGAFLRTRQRTQPESADDADRRRLESALSA